MTKAVGYVRVSTAGQAEKSMGLDAQRRRVRDYAKEKGLELVDVVEEAASGGVQNGEVFSWEHRPVLLALLERADGGDFDTLIVAKLDRLSRDYATLTVLERMLQKRGVSVVSTAEENGDGPVAEYLRGNLALIAQLERAMIRERVNAGKAEGKRRGRHVHGRVPYGYHTVAADDEKGRTLEPVEPNAAIVRSIFKDAAAGDSFGRIAKQLNQAGVPSPNGSTWTRKAVSRILSNEAYSGVRYGVKKAHEAIVSRRLWNAAQNG